MAQTITIGEQGLSIVIRITKDGEVLLLHCSMLPFDEDVFQDEAQQQAFRLVELQASGENQQDHCGSKHTGTLPAARLRYQRHQEYCTEHGRKIEIEMYDVVTGLLVTSHLQSYEGLPVVRTWTVIANTGSIPVGLEYVSSFALTGLAKEGLLPWDRKMRVHIPHNTWYGEAQWRSYTLPDLGLSQVNTFSMKRLSYGSSGTWSTSQFLPMGVLANRETGSALFWQIEHNGSWHWEISDIANQLYLQLSGPTEQEHQWWKELLPDETFTTVPVAVGAVAGDNETCFEQAIGVLTRYRRRIRRPNHDNRELPVIFNDYMNCLMGDPTTEKLLPLIDAAAEAGCEYFCIDAGWYADGNWWDSVGEWLPSKQRFPDGLQVVLEYIRGKGLLPGLWLEMEVMGIHSRVAREVSDDWFFCRHGKRVHMNGRYQLDFRHPAVIAYADSVIDRLVQEYGVGYIKMDYNINAGIGTEVAADSFGDGLLQHNRAYLAWLDSVFARYPQLVIENCGSGGMRMDYALLSRHSIQSSSDQTDYRRMAAIAAACPTGVTPEQCAVWSYPLLTGDREEVIFNMVNAILLRIHQSGHLAMLSQERFALVKEGIALYKTIRGEIAQGLPIWPLGLPHFDDQWISLGLVCDATIYLAVWRLSGGDETCVLPCHHLRDQALAVDCIYPAEHACRWNWSSSAGTLSVTLPQQNSARLMRLTKQVSEA